MKVFIIDIGIKFLYNQIVKCRADSAQEKKYSLILDLLTTYERIKLPSSAELERNKDPEHDIGLGNIATSWITVWSMVGVFTNEVREDKFEKIGFSLSLEKLSGSCL
jgi:hypothetical protein